MSAITALHRVSLSLYSLSPWLMEVFKLLRPRVYVRLEIQPAKRFNPITDSGIQYNISLLHYANISYRIQFMYHCTETLAKKITMTWLVGYSWIKNAMSISYEVLREGSAAPSTVSQGRRVVSNAVVVKSSGNCGREVKSIFWVLNGWCLPGTSIPCGKTKTKTKNTSSLSLNEHHNIRLAVKHWHNVCMCHNICFI